MKQIQARQDETLKLIKEIILNVANKYGIEIDKIILFGSRARGDYKEDSDWDILIITKRRYDKNVLDGFWMDVDKKLVYLGIIPEIIAVDRKTFEMFKRPAYVFYYAEKEGIVIK